MDATLHCQKLDTRKVLDFIMKLYMIHCPSSSQDKIVERVPIAAPLQLPPHGELLAHFARKREGGRDTDSTLL